MIYLTGVHQKSIVVYDEDDCSIEYVTKNDIINAYECGVKFHDIGDSTYSVLKDGYDMYYDAEMLGLCKNRQSRIVKYGATMNLSATRIITSPVFDYALNLRDYSYDIYCDGWVYHFSGFGVAGVRVTEVHPNSNRSDPIGYVGYSIKDKCAVLGGTGKYELRDGNICDSRMIVSNKGVPCKLKDCLRKWTLE